MVSSLTERLAATLPTAPATLLLRAALLEDLDAWHAWTDVAGDPERAIRTNRDEVRRLTPLLVRGAGRLPGFRTPAVLTALRVADRMAESRSRLVRDLAGSAFAAMGAARVPYVVLGGTAVAETVYPAPSLRHCHDLDLLVPRSVWGRATRTLAATGFQPVSWWARPRWEDGRVLVHSSGLPIVLHDRLLAEPFDRPPLEETEARTVMGVDALLLTPEAALLRGSCHVVSTVARAGVQWMADAWHLLRGSSSFDWDRLLAQAGDGARAAALGGVLGRLVRDLDVEVPGEVLRRLERPSGSACLVTVRGSSLGFRMARRIATLPTALWRRAPR